MKRKLQILTSIFCFLGALSISAQDTFDDKKRSSASTAKTIQNKKFDFSNLKVKEKRAILSQGKSNYQMPSIFNLNGSIALYDHEVLKSSESGLPVFIESEATEETKKFAKSQSVETVGVNYLNDIKGLLHIKEPSSEFQNISKKVDDLGQTHLKMQQVYQGVKVYGSEVVVHLDKSKEVHAFNGRSTPTPQLKSIVPKISMQQALSSIENDLGKALPKTNTAKKSGFNSLVGPYEPEEELVIYTINGTAILTRHITVFPSVIDRWEYFVDANTGQVLDKFYHTCKFHADFEENHNEPSNSIIVPPTNTSGQDLNGVNRQLNTWSNGTQNYLIDISKPMFDAEKSVLPDNAVGGIVTLDLRGEAPGQGVKIFHVTASGNTWGNTNGVSAHYNADISYEYFRTTFNRNSINGEGGSIISFINVGNPEGGGDYDNAFWNGKAMFYGNGDRAFTSLAGSLDVGGHEMSHGVIDNTANLEYRNQSGALNESFADIFGVMIDRDDWKLGEDIVTNLFPSGAMRDMQNPNNGASADGQIGWQPKDMSEFVVTTRDNGGVHINSGIVNRAYYLVATAIGKDKAEQVYYRALDNYLTASSQFIDLRLAVIKSATDIHGAGSTEVQAAETAFDTVGITDGEGSDIEDDIPVANGDEFILSLDIRDTDPNTLYISDTNGENFVPLTTTRILRKPSVADDGSFAIYVTENNTVNAVTLDANNPVESVISAEQIWGQVALSKDGTKLAAIRNDQDNVIYISDLISSESQAFELFNPTSQDGVTTGEVLYPDALEWDYSGEYLIYDALNRIDNGEGNDIDYWDVGALKVWDNQSNAFGDGSIQKLFSNLPEGVSIGNPSFAKTSGNILAFDVFDDSDDTYEVIAANIETGDVKTVYQNNKLGFPNYSKTDDKLIFDSFNNGDEDILAINMGADKITSSGNPSELIPNGKWGIWYTVGERSTLSSEKEITDFRFNVVNPAAIGVINGSQITVDLPNNINRENLVATFASSAKSSVAIADTQQQSGVNANDFTNAVMYRVTAEDGTTKDFIVTIGTSGPVNPNDDDGDGVLNADDQCANTPPNTTVDITGCEIFSLPSNNFRVSAKGESCIESNNGSISVEATENHNYTTTLTGNGVNATNNFTNTISFDNLEGGSYTVCITIDGQAGYESCFKISVAQPEALSVSSKVNLTAKTVTLNLSGADEYTISLNDEILVTRDSEVTIPLRTSEAKLTVKTDKNCQGVYEESFDLNDRVIVYPNPVSSGEISVELGKVLEKPIPIQLNTFDGRMVMQKNTEPNTSTIKINAENLAAGIYVLSIQIDGETKTFKIVKQ